CRLLMPSALLHGHSIVLAHASRLPNSLKISFSEWFFHPISLEKSRNPSAANVTQAPVII
ncbi:hypothetical protein, partial [Neobacillus paridis]|uniref:hypothetical protein n=1 Tax=Neobacillus paridis TaxID=2803862 RepID=UPI001F2AB1B5